MPDAPAEKTDAWDRAYDRITKATKSRFHDWKFKRATASLERDLAQIIETANSHHAKKQPNGAQVFLALVAQADSKILAFTTKWQVSVDSVQDQIPALHDLRALAVPSPHVPKQAMVLAGIVGAILTLILIGGASGLVEAGNHWAMHLLTR